MYALTLSLSKHSYMYKTEWNDNEIKKRTQDMFFKMNGNIID